ncbi:predicted protein [Naegleria gruberi]|uniref:Predicted protein n=1 Tax=Naegleria gruberi TaxID=5762 RepID=D2VVK3_NAEGR|nr:uncharacterized protein NAEGRDRAFT_52605 [Naegleria gruberi]EFC39050.1 predicted protein [Naegleria gruberi]|eukprot:XP_002671794.1 predicted protein [Naegleria gruberi strain NEG-M]
MKLLLVLFSLIAIALAFGTHVYLQSKEFDGVEISTIGASLVIKTMIKTVGARVKLVESLMPKLNQTSDSLRIETIPITFDTSSSEVYLKEVGEPVAKYALRVYQPKQNRDGGYPIVMYIHGGGWMFGNIDISNRLCEGLANKGFIVVSIDYRRTPEHIFPSCLNDNLNALSWIGRNYEKYNGNINQLIISGDSAGGHLAITTQIRLFSIQKKLLERESIPSVTHQALLYPVADFYRYGDEKYESYMKYRDNGLIIDGAVMDMFWRNFIGNNTEEQVKSNPLISPVSGLILSDKVLYSQFPKGFIWLAEYDVLKDEGKSFANAVNNASPNKLKVKEWKSCVHGFIDLKRNYDEMADAIYEVLGKINKQS